MVDGSLQADTMPTRFARLTAAGRSAVATVAVFGPAATDQVGNYFRPASGKKLAAIPVGQVAFGRWISARGSTEELVVCRRHEQRVDIHCHGGDAAVEAIQDSLSIVGCVASEAEELMRYEQQDRLAIQAWQAMTEARTRRGALLMLTQYHGAFRNGLLAIMKALEGGEKQSAREQLQRMQNLAAVGLHVTRPWQVVLVGPPNAGKSSLVNKLLGFRRSIVHDQPGTTRDLLTTSTAWDGWPIELVDTAGVREGAEGVEQEGIAKVRQQQREADLFVLVVDGQEDWSPAMQQLADFFLDAILVYNKSDLLGHAADEDSVMADSSVDRPPGVVTSAVNGQGLDCLVDQIVQRLVPVTPGSGDAVPFTQSQARFIETVLDLLENDELAQAMQRLKQFLDEKDPLTELPEHQI